MPQYSTAHRAVFEDVLLRESLNSLRATLARHGGGDSALQDRALHEWLRVDLARLQGLLGNVLVDL